MGYATLGPSTVTGGSHSKSSYVQLTASAPFAVEALWITIFDDNPAGNRGLLDLATGSAGSESVIISNLMWACRAFQGASFLIPYQIASGTRLAFRAQCAVAAVTVSCAVTLIEAGTGPYPAVNAVSSYGVTNLSLTEIATIDPGGTANTKGSYTQLTSATAADHDLWLFAVGNEGNDARTTSSGFRLDLATGPAGSETVLIPDLHLHLSTIADAPLPLVVGPLPLYVPSGTRLAARAQSGITGATDRTFDLMAYGLSYSGPPPATAKPILIVVS
jgi:hypothetical protein